MNESFQSQYVAFHRSHLQISSVSEEYQPVLRTSLNQLTHLIKLQIFSESFCWFFLISKSGLLKSLKRAFPAEPQPVEVAVSLYRQNTSSFPVLPHSFHDSWGKHATIKVSFTVFAVFEWNLLSVNECIHQHLVNFKCPARRPEEPCETLRNRVRPWGCSRLSAWWKRSCWRSSASACPCGVVSINRLLLFYVMMAMFSPVLIKDAHCLTSAEGDSISDPQTNNQKQTWL